MSSCMVVKQAQAGDKRSMTKVPKAQWESFTMRGDARRHLRTFNTARSWQRSSYEKKNYHLWGHWLRKLFKKFSNTTWCNVGLNSTGLWACSLENTQNSSQRLAVSIESRAEKHPRATAWLTNFKTWRDIFILQMMLYLSMNCNRHVIQL